MIWRASRAAGDLRDHAERLLARMNLVTREEFDVVAAMASAARMEQERLAERVIALEASLAALQTTPSSTQSASAAASKPPRRRRAES
jgi:BMFP domain-containing protein YqiC